MLAPSILIAAGDAADENFVSFDVPVWAWVALVGVHRRAAHRRPAARPPHRARHHDQGSGDRIRDLDLDRSRLRPRHARRGRGGQAAGEYYAGFLIEKSLSVDNVFVWAVIFSFFAVPKQYQFRVLFWGIFGALVLRADLHLRRRLAHQHFEWVLYVFGAFLLYTAVKIARHDESKHVDYNNNIAMRLVRRLVPTTNEYDGQKLFTRINAKRVATPLFAVLILIEATDVVFAVDSVPAVLAVEPRAVHRVRLERVRDPRPAVAVLPARRHAGQVPLPQHRPRCDPRLRRHQDAADRRALRGPPADVRSR